MKMTLLFSNFSCLCWKSMIVQCIVIYERLHCFLNILLLGIIRPSGNLIKLLRSTRYEFSVLFMSLFFHFRGEPGPSNRLWSLSAKVLLSNFANQCLVAVSLVWHYIWVPKTHLFDYLSFYWAEKPRSYIDCNLNYVLNHVHLIDFCSLHILRSLFSLVRKYLFPSASVPSSNLVILC